MKAYEAGQAAGRGGDEATAWQRYFEAVEIQDDMWPALRSLAAIARRRGDYGAALEYYGRAYRATPVGPLRIGVLKDRASAFVDVRRYADAVQLFEELKALDPQNLTRHDADAGIRECGFAREAGGDRIDGGWLELAAEQIALGESKLSDVVEFLGEPESSDAVKHTLKYKPGPRDRSMFYDLMVFSFSETGTLQTVSLDPSFNASVPLVKYLLRGAVFEGEVPSEHVENGVQMRWLLGGDGDVSLDVVFTTRREGSEPLAFLYLYKRLAPGGR